VTRLLTIDGLDINPAAVRSAFIRDRPGRIEPHGPSGFSLRLFASSGVCNGSVIVTQAEHDGAEWIHASIARENHMPSYDDLVRLKHGVFGPERYAYQVFPAADRHISIHDRALHLWGRADGANALPDFGRLGSI